MAYMLGPEGQAVLQANDQPLVLPAVGYDYDRIPRDLQELCEPQS